MTRFLLDDATDSERAEVEDRLLKDEEFYERLLAAEADLMDAYVRGALPSRERARFEEVFLSSPQQSERVDLSRALARSATLLHEQESANLSTANQVTAESSRRKGFLALLATQFTARPALRYAAAAVAIAVVAGGVWLAVDRMRVRQQIGPPQQARTEGVAPQQPKQPSQNGEVVSSKPTGNENQNPIPTPERKPTPEAQQNRTQPVFATLTLAPGAMRDGAAAANLAIPRGATHVRLKLEIETDDYPNYRATITTPEGRTVWAGSVQKDRRRDAGSVTLNLPASSLKRGDYIIELSGAVAGRSERTAQYSFRVTRED